MKPEAVVFDIGNVLIGWQPEHVYDRIVGPARRAELFVHVDLHGYNDRVDRGENFHSVMEEAIATHVDFCVELGVWRDRWLDLTGPVIERSVRVLRALRKQGVPVFALSNFGVETFDWAKDRYPFLNEFDRSFISGHMRTAKPDCDIYQRLEEETGLVQDALLFTDDRAENIAAAKARGWQVHLFDGAAGWAQCVAEHGLLSKEDAR